jgi:CheY-like chemotaxis protein
VIWIKYRRHFDVKVLNVRFDVPKILPGACDCRCRPDFAIPAPRSVLNMPSIPLPAPRAGRPAAILLAVDPADSAALRAMQPSAGMTFEFVDSADAAIEHALSRDFDLLLLGLTLDGIGAIAAADILRRAGASCQLAAVGNRTASALLPEVFDHHLSLPLTRDAVVALLESRGASARLDSDWGDGWIARECADLVAEFRASLPGTALTLAQAARDGDPAALRSLVHALKGSAGAYGFAWVTQRCASIESDILLGRVDAALAASATLADDIRRAPEA